MQANLFLCFVAVVLVAVGVVAQATAEWTKHVIDGNLDGAFGLYVADMDGDTDLDVIASIL